MSASLEALPKPLASFLREMPPNCADLMEPMADALAAIDDEGNDVEDAAAALTAFTKIAALPLPFIERLMLMSDLASQRGKVTVTFNGSNMHIESRPS
jgi:hypothetical protein